VSDTDRTDAAPPPGLSGPSRRALLLAGIAPALLGATSLPGRTQGVAHPGRRVLADMPRLFLTDAEATLLTAMVDRIIPRDEWPSASDVGVVNFFDVQLAADWGRGQGLYRQGPYLPGKPSQGYQLSYTPSELYRRALAHPALASFGSLDAAAQDALLTQLEKDEIALDDIPGRTFFVQFRQNTLEGYFTDEIHGGNRDLVGWQMLGFPGAHAYYLTEIDRFDLHYRRPSTGIRHRPALARPASHPARP
jgi:hypothetical protein